MSQKICIHCFVTGQVQGVWYRAGAKQLAEQLGVNGWARNLKDGRVEVYACGAASQLELFYTWLQHGPERAKVTEVTRQDWPWEDYKGFATF